MQVRALTRILEKVQSCIYMTTFMTELYLALLRVLVDSQFTACSIRYYANTC